LAGIKLLCETDFVAKNETFAELIDTLLEKVISHKSEVTSLESIDAGLLESLNTTIAEFIGKI
jgi:translation elongation factor EF-Ts